jgi:hypothetical protein
MISSLVTRRKWIRQADNLVAIILSAETCAGRPCMLRVQDPRTLCNSMGARMPLSTAELPLLSQRTDLPRLEAVIDSVPKSAVDLVLSQAICGCDEHTAKSHIDVVEAKRGANSSCSFPKNSLTVLRWQRCRCSKNISVALHYSTQVGTGAPITVQVFRSPIYAIA